MPGIPSKDASFVRGTPRNYALTKFQFDNGRQSVVTFSKIRGSTGKIYRGSTCQLKHDLLNFPLLHEEVPTDRKTGYPYGYCLRYKCGLESGL